MEKKIWNITVDSNGTESIVTVKGTLATAKRRAKKIEREAEEAGNDFVYAYKIVNANDSSERYQNGTLFSDGWVAC